jgi:hypothetical protein
MDFVGWPNIGASNRHLQWHDLTTLGFTSLSTNYDPWD